MPAPARGRFDYGEEGQLFDVTGVSDERIAVRVDTRPVAGDLLAGLDGAGAGR